MTQVQAFEFSPFAENTYVVWDETGECAIFDPGCYTVEERETLQRLSKKKTCARCDSSTPIVTWTMCLGTICGQNLGNWAGNP
jgi:hypothetical protein